MKPNWFIGWPVVPSPGLLEELPSPPAGVRVFSAVDLHATLAFLGPVSEDAALRAFTLATEWMGAPIQARFGAVVPMGRPERPSALAAELSDDGDRLVEAMLKFRKPMQRAAGARIDRRPPRPHVTRRGPATGHGAPADRRLEWASISSCLSNPSRCSPWRLHLGPGPTPQLVSWSSSTSSVLEAARERRGPAAVGRPGGPRGEPIRAGTRRDIREPHHAPRLRRAAGLRSAPRPSRPPPRADGARHPARDHRHARADRRAYVTRSPRPRTSTPSPARASSSAKRTR